MSGLTEQRNGALAAIVEENPRIVSSSFCRKQSLEPLLYCNHSPINLFGFCLYMRFVISDSSNE